ncbi:MAG: hypothetical protein NVSMB2_05230 [Chloroflexota bacterium]
MPTRACGADRSAYDRASEAHGRCVGRGIASDSALTLGGCVSRGRAETGCIAGRQSSREPEPGRGELSKAERPARANWRSKGLDWQSVGDGFRPVRGLAEGARIG